MANDINSVILVGRCVKDLENKYTQNGSCIGNVSIACNRAKKQGDSWVDEVSFFDITIFGKTAENLKKYLVKGQQIAVSGFLKQDRWEKDGRSYSKICIVADNVQLTGGKKDEGKGTFRPDKVYNSAQEALEADAPCTSDFNEDLPF